MTREEAIAVFKGFKFLPREMKAVDMAIKALQQEPCTQEKQANADNIDAVYIEGFKAGYAQARFDLEQESCTDAISRQAALSHKVYTETEEGWSGYTVDADVIENLPPVNPAEKVGQWEWNQYDSNPKIGNFHCSQCHGIGRSYYDYCPYCGAKMASPTGAESEGGTQHDD